MNSTSLVSSTFIQEAAPARRPPLPVVGAVEPGRELHAPPNPHQEPPVQGPNEAEQMRPAGGSEGPVENAQQQGPGIGDQPPGQDRQQFTGPPGAGLK